MRTGLLSASAAMAMGAVAVASGLLPGPGGTYIDGSRGPDSRVRPDGLPDLHTQLAPPPPEDRDASDAGHDPERVRTPKSAPSPPEAERSEPRTPEPTTPSSEGPATDPTGDPAPEEETTPPTEEEPATPEPEPTADAGTAAEAAVLRLVNEERATVGCSPLRADSRLAELAGNFSSDMALEGFFSHTAPDGSSPWDRAQALGIDNLGAENIARGQADAQAVVRAWMESPGHRANILNCDYRTLGVGVHFGTGGPWWTQSFGF